jgi:cell division protein FtsQ
VSKATAISPPARSWRNIPQQVKPRAMSREGHRRLVLHSLRVAGAVAVVAVVGWGAWETAEALQEGPRALPGTAVAAPVQNVILVTDGVLDRAWLTHTLALPRKATLMDLDLDQLKERLLTSRQVASASVVRNFPATLQVRISERAPVARILVQQGDSEPRALLVARDGVVYEGAGYELPLLDTLPWIDGVKLVRRDGRVAPIAGMDSVAELLARAKMEAEPLYRTWHVVSLARLAADGQIEVRTRDGMKVTFGTQEDYFRQIARLDLILDAARARGAGPVQAVDLSLDDQQVPVTLGAAAPAGAQEAGSGRFDIPNQREL